MMAAAGLIPAAEAPGYAPVKLEALALHPPDALVLGFFDPASAQTLRWSHGRAAPVRRLIRARAVASLPGALLGCPAWFAADGARMLAARAR
jgi:iron complex transport system substrate-binding protein